MDHTRVNSEDMSPTGVIPGPYTTTALTVDVAGRVLAVTSGPAPAPATRNINTTAPLTGGGNLTADRTLAVSDFVASGVGHFRGTVPDPGAVAGTSRFLREDASFAVPITDLVPSLLLMGA